MKKIMDLGEKTSTIAVFGGPYSNLQATQKLKGVLELKKIQAENIICTGDFIAYCAQPEETASFIRKWGVHTIAGNVEIQLREDAEDCGCNFTADSKCDALSKQWYPYAKDRISEKTKAFLHGLPEFISFKINKKKAVVVHGSYFDTSEFIFNSTPWSVKQKNFDVTGSDIIIAGHCGLPFHDMQNGNIWLNAGVIGMPANDGTQRGWYATLEPRSNGIKIEHVSFTYNNIQAASLMEQKNLPSEYSKTLLTGIWDNCDILFEEEMQQQGKKLEFTHLFFAKDSY